MIFQYGVSELLNNIKLTLSESFPLIYVIGELSEISQNAKSNHVYFNLKDAEGSLYCVCWQGIAKNYDFTTFTNQQIKVKARVSSFSNSKFYLNILEITQHAQGNLKLQLDSLKQLLEKEQYFNLQKNKILTNYPNTIGLITSLNGAVMHDIINTLTTKIPVKVKIYNANVQGAESANQIMLAIDYFNQSTEPVDFIIIARGGGSDDDLSAFNDVDLVKAIATSPIAIITAIGHQPNSTLSDLASTKSFATPTAAVAWLPNKSDMVNNITKYNNILAFKISNLFKTIGNSLSFNNRLLNNTNNKYARYKDRLSFLTNALKMATKNNIINHQTTVNQLSYKLQQPDKLRFYTYKIFGYDKRLAKNADKVNYLLQNLQNLDRLLETLSFKATLKRGFSVIYKAHPTNESSIVSDISKLTDGDYLITSHNGSKNVTIKHK